MTTILCAAVGIATVGIATVFGYWVVAVALWNNTLRYWDKVLITFLLAIISFQGAALIINWIVK